jgi:polyphosphate kinase
VVDRARQNGGVVSVPDGSVGVERSERYVNRELSALDFNERVLGLALDRTAPLLERVRFLSIVASNLDEFFMVRIAGLMSQLGSPAPVDGRMSAGVLAELRRRIVAFSRDQERLWLDELCPALAGEGIVVGELGRLDESDRAWITEWFEREVFPILTPLAVSPGQPFPYVSGLSLSLGLLVRHPGANGWHLGRVKVPESVPRFVPLGHGGVVVPVEQVVADFLPRLYPGAEVSGCAVFRVTRDADFEISDDADDLLEAVESKLRRRRFGDVVRLEVAASAAAELVTRLQHGLRIGADETYRVEGLLDRSELSELASLDRPDLKYERWRPVTPARLRRGAEGFLSEVHAGDVLVQHPYDSFPASVGEFLSAAAVDQRVLALKTTVYRTNEASPLGPALSAAVEAGKQAVCLVELKARFDEQHNIEWARGLEQAGVHVVYGFPDLKIHAKMTLVIGREDHGLRRYAHIGTGNYHALTAGLYEDFGLFTSDLDITTDVAALFNYLTGYGDPPTFRKLVVAPWGLRSRILAEIRRVSEASAAGDQATIKLKLNSLTDEGVIDALYDASSQGVQIEVVVRGLCCLRAGVEGLSDNITVVSVLGRFLEHSRFYIFEASGRTTILMGSADLMSRNLDRRIEVLVPIEDEPARRELHWVFRSLMRDTDHAWRLQPDGSWQPNVPADDRQPRSSQRVLMRRAARMSRRAQPDGGRV